MCPTYMQLQIKPIIFFSVEACADDEQDELSGELESREHESRELEEPTGKSNVIERYSVW